MELRVHATTTATGGIPVVAIAATPFDHRSWEAVARQLTRAPLFVLSGPVKPTAETTMDAHVDGIIHTLDSLGIQKAVIAGSGLMGETVLQFAASRPDRVAGLVVAGATGEAATLDDRSRWLEATIATMGAVDDAVVYDTIRTLVNRATSAHTRSNSAIVNLLNEWIRTCDPREVSWVLRTQSSRLDVIDALSGLRIPTTVLRGEDDAGTTREGALRLVDALCTVLHDVPQAASLIHFENPGRFAQGINAILPFVG
ncbi:MAG: alpha/beta hydrolase [Actinomycetaceae bacterium]|nr:alpha/beta hydrolase [Actinomycetaceae bacterium]